MGFSFRYLSEWLGINVIWCEREFIDSYLNDIDWFKSKDQSIMHIIILSG